MAAAAADERVVRSVAPLGFPFKTLDPFLFCVYHNDAYPAGNANNMEAPRRGNGADFDCARPHGHDARRRGGARAPTLTVSRRAPAGSTPYRMYHGERVPGFPQHPHRGFETVTLVQEGTVDHTDSLGQGGRYGGDGRAGDVQWMTAGAGCVHGEMFPLRHTDRPNTLKLFQIWLNLAPAAKMCAPGYVMTWAEQMTFLSGEGGAECEVAAGRLGGVAAGAPPPPHSWAADARNDVGVFLVTLPPGSRFTLPPAEEGAAVNRAAYVVEGPTQGAGARIAGVAVPGGRGELTLRGDAACVMENAAASGAPVQVLVLQGRPIGAPVAQRGPFVMNTQAELQQAFADYSRTRFGGWPWPEDAVVFPREQGRFADVVDAGGAKRRLVPPAPAPAAGKAEL